jgi:hypothetical protein
MRSFTPLQFLSRFTPEEQADVILSDDPQVRVFRFLFAISDRVISTDPRLEQGRLLLVSKGLITAERAAVIFDFGE